MTKQVVSDVNNGSRLMVQQDDPNDRFANRIVELELTLTHLQRDVEGLNRNDPVPKLAN